MRETDTIFTIRFLGDKQLEIVFKCITSLSSLAFFVGSFLEPQITRTYIYECDRRKLIRDIFLRFPESVYDDRVLNISSLFGEE